MLHESSNRYRKGQVWLWIDPVYGEKKSTTHIKPGEIALRFNRYVIVYQVSPLNNSVICIPCSSNGKTDKISIKVQINQLFMSNYSYAKPELIFPTHPHLLNRYICTLSDDDISNIDMAVQYIMGFNNIHREYFEDTDAFYIPTVDHIANGQHLKEFLDEYFEITGNSNDIVTTRVLRSRFDQFCIMKSYNLIYNGVEYLSLLNRYLHEYGGMITTTANQSTISNYTILNCKLKPMPSDDNIKHGSIDNIFDDNISKNEYIEDTKITSNASDSSSLNKLIDNNVDQLINSASKVFEYNSFEMESEVSNMLRNKSTSKNIWTDEAIQEFLQYADTHSDTETANKFNIALNTFKAYRRMFTKQMANYNNITNQKKSDQSNHEKIPLTPENIIDYLTNNIVANVNTTRSEIIKICPNFDTILNHISTRVHDLFDTYVIKRCNDSFGMKQFVDNVITANIPLYENFDSFLGIYKSVYASNNMIKQSYINSVIFTIKDKFKPNYKAIEIIRNALKIVC